MLRIHFVSLFPELMLESAHHSILKRAVAAGILDLTAVDPRDFSKDKHHTVDDKPFGGGPGMLLKPEPVADAIKSLNLQSGTPIILTDPTGERFQQKDAIALSQHDEIAFVCGHYEGIDDRIRQLYATHVYSIGDFILTGGELPALVMADAIVRLRPGVLGCAESLEIDAHSDGLLSAPQFTRPDVFENIQVPEVLKSGDHKAVELWKRREALQLTRKNRPDLFTRARLAKKDIDMLNSLIRAEAAALDNSTE